MPVRVEALGDERGAAATERVTAANGVAARADLEDARLVERLEQVVLNLLDLQQRRLAQEVVARERVGRLLETLSTSSSQKKNLYKLTEYSPRPCMPHVAPTRTHTVLSTCIRPMPCPTRIAPPRRERGAFQRMHTHRTTASDVDVDARECRRTVMHGQQPCVGSRIKT